MQNKNEVKKMRNEDSLFWPVGVVILSQPTSKDQETKF